jgi:hypothetical protein
MAFEALMTDYLSKLALLTAFCALLLWLVSKGKSIVFAKYTKSEIA